MAAFHRADTHPSVARIREWNTGGAEGLGAGGMGECQKDLLQSRDNIITDSGPAVHARDSCAQHDVVANYREEGSPNVPGNVDHSQERQIETAVLNDEAELMPLGSFRSYTETSLDSNFEPQGQAEDESRADSDEKKDKFDEIDAQQQSVAQIGAEFEAFLRRAESMFGAPEQERQLLDSACSSLRIDEEDQVSGDGRHTDEFREKNRGAVEAELAPEVVKALKALPLLQVRIANGPRWDLEGYVTAVDVLLAVREALVVHGYAEGIQAAESLLETAVEHLEEELGDAVAKHSKPLDGGQLRALALRDAAAVMRGAQMSSSPSGGKESEGPETALRQWLLVGAVPFLQKMTKRMHAAGAAQRCVAKYRKARAPALNQCVRNLYSKEPLASQLAGASWPELEEYIKGWIRDLTLLVKVVLQGEAALCQCLLAGLGDIQEACFRELMKESLFPQAVALLLNRGAAIARGKCLPERLFALLDMFNTVNVLSPQVVALCASAEVTALSNALEELPGVLLRAVQATFVEFHRVLEDSQPPASSKPPRLRFPWRSQVSQADDALPPDGAVHVTTSYVVNYIKAYLARNGSPDYCGLLEDLLSKQVCGGSQRKQTVESETSLLLESLWRSLEARAAGSHDPALRELFLMNNFTYVHKSMSDKNALRLELPVWQTEELGDRHALAFKQASLGKVTRLLTDRHNVLLGGAPDVLQDCNRRLKRFNAAFEELALQQGAWEVPDEERRRRIRHDWSTTLKDAYSRFLLPHKAHLLDVPSYRYSPDRIGSMILDLFFLGTQR